MLKSFAMVLHIQLRMAWDMMTSFFPMKRTDSSPDLRGRYEGIENVIRISAVRGTHHNPVISFNPDKAAPE